MIHQCILVAAKSFGTQNIAAVIFSCWGSDIVKERLFIHSHLIADSSCGTTDVNVTLCFIYPGYPVTFHMPPPSLISFTIFRTFKFIMITQKDMHMSHSRPATILYILLIAEYTIFLFIQDGWMFEQNIGMRPSERLFVSCCQLTIDIFC